MTTAKLKTDIFRFIEEMNDKNLLSALREMLVSKSKGKQQDFWDELSAGERAEIMKGIEDLDKGRYHSLSEVMAKHKKK